jgi:hypothetical protein
MHFTEVHMKRLLALILISPFVLLLAACGDGANAGGDGAGSGAAAGGDGAGGGKSRVTETSWVKVTTLKGATYTTNMTSSPFELQGGQQEVSYEVSGSGSIALTIYVEQLGTLPEDERGPPIVALAAAGTDSIRLDRGEGEYRIVIDSMDCAWTVTISELR